MFLKMLVLTAVLKKQEFFGIGPVCLKNIFLLLMKVDDMMHEFDQYVLYHEMKKKTEVKQFELKNKNVLFDFSFYRLVKIGFD